MMRDPITSEALEPLLVGVFSWCLRDYAESDQGDAAEAVLRTQVKLLGRLTIVNRSGGAFANACGVHADLAVGRLRERVWALLALPTGERRTVLACIMADCRQADPTGAAVDAPSDT